MLRLRKKNKVKSKKYFFFGFITDSRTCEIILAQSKEKRLLFGFAIDPFENLEFKYFENNAELLRS
jgi:hypothetical protein